MMLVVDGQETTALLVRGAVVVLPVALNAILRHTRPVPNLSAVREKPLKSTRKKKTKPGAVRQKLNRSDVPQRLGKSVKEHKLKLQMERRLDCMATTFRTTRNKR